MTIPRKGSLPAASIVLPYIDASSAWALALLIVLLALYAVRRRMALLLSALMLAVAVVAWGWYIRSDEPGGSILFFNSSKFPALLMTASRDCSYMLSTEEESEVEKEYIVDPYLRCESMDAPLWVNSDYFDANFSYVEGVAEFCGRRIMLLSGKNWMDSKQNFSVDILFLCKGFKGSMDSLLALHPAKYVVMDAGLHFMTRRRVERECAALGIVCIDVSETGAVAFDCRADSFSPMFMSGK